MQQSLEISNFLPFPIKKITARNRVTDCNISQISAGFLPNPQPQRGFAEIFANLRGNRAGVSETFRTTTSRRASPDCGTV